ncbi:unnamed protein product [Heterobilharzia americana]|nr:unnamed protein product [Heterobilharzia americana]
MNISSRRMDALYPNFYSLTSVSAEPLDPRVRRRSLVWGVNATPISTQTPINTTTTTTNINDGNDENTKARKKLDDNITIIPSYIMNYSQHTPAKSKGLMIRRRSASHNPNNRNQLLHSTNSANIYNNNNQQSTTNTNFIDISASNMIPANCNNNVNNSPCSSNSTTPPQPPPPPPFADKDGKKMKTRDKDEGDIMDYISLQASRSLLPISSLSQTPVLPTTSIRMCLTGA